MASIFLLSPRTQVHGFSFHDLSRTSETMNSPHYFTCAGFHGNQDCFCSKFLACNPVIHSAGPTDGPDCPAVEITNGNRVRAALVNGNMQVAPGNPHAGATGRLRIIAAVFRSR
jgi:hypothetical protein